LVSSHRRRWNLAGHVIGSPLETIEDVGRCRVVVTGTFHPAVFALSQGIPVVALAQSTLYVEKFLGLADQFKGGCQIVRLDDEQLGTNLERAIDRAWSSAGELRPQLLETAAAMIERGHAGYQRLHDLVEAN
jgi:polysaccharide pyruvyl transferase WcaK-like protein